MSEESYIGMFYPERFISLENNIVSETVPHSELLIHEQYELVRWMIYWDGAQSLQLFGVTKDGLAILQNRIELQGETKRAALKYAKKLMPHVGSGEWSHCPFLVYTGSRYSYKHACHYVYQVFWNGHCRFMLGIGDEYCDEEDIEASWFTKEVCGYVSVDYDDDWGYVDNPGADLEVPNTRSNYADAPEDLVSAAEHLIEMEAVNLDAASVSDVFNDLNGSITVGCINGVGTVVFGLVSFTVKFVIYGLIGLILLNIINEFTGWYDDSTADDFGSLFVASAVGLWGTVWLFKWAWLQWRESRGI